MKTISELAKELGIKRQKTLSFRLWEAGIECSIYETRQGRSIKLYDAKTARRVRQYIKDNPVHASSGRPRLEKGEKK